MPNGVFMRLPIFVLLCCIAGQGVADEPWWGIATQKEGITVFSRKAEGENVAEVKADTGPRFFENPPSPMQAQCLFWRHFRLHTTNKPVDITAVFSRHVFCRRGYTLVFHT